MKQILVAGAALIVGLGLIADPALARAKHGKRHVAQRQCIDQPGAASLGDWLFGVRPHPQWNGCAPPVYGNDGEYIGQDPDPNIRAALRRVPDEGYRTKQ